MLHGKLGQCSGAKGEGVAERPPESIGQTGPVFAYVTDIDPALSTFGWKIIGLAHVALLVPLIGALLPRESATNWVCVGIAAFAVAFLGGLNLFHFRRMVRSDGYKSPTPLLLLIEVMFATVATALAGYALGGTIGIYRPLIFVPTLLMAMIGNRWMIVVSWMTATAAVTFSAVASNSVNEAVAAFTISYGVVWGVIATMVHLMALASLHSDSQMSGLAEVAGIAARANNLSEGIEEVLPVITAWSGAKRAGAYWITPYEDRSVAQSVPETIYVWPEGAGIARPTVLEVAAAREHRGIDLHQHRSVLVVEGGEHEDWVAIVLEEIAHPSYDRLMTRFNLERMALQIAVLVGRTRFVAKLEDMGRTDVLTGLPNRRELTDRLAQARREARRRGGPLSVVMIDLDHFKGYNDTFGHQAGDELLRCFGNELHTRLRAVDCVARYGGEEFCMILPDTDAGGAERLLEKLQTWFRTLDCLHGVTFSAGVAAWDMNEGAETLIGRADTALYEAKNTGRDRTVIHHHAR